MAYNHGLAKKKFKNEWKGKEKQYRELGMTEKQISAIREFDEQEFRAERVDLEKKVPLAEADEFRQTTIDELVIDNIEENWYEFERFTHVNTSEIQEFLYNILYPEEHIIWIEDGTEIRLCICQKDIRRKISLLLFSKDNVILTSATISDKHRGTPFEKCGYYLDSIGFPAFGRV